MVLVLTSVLLFMAEACLAWFAFAGLWLFAGWLARTFTTRGPVRVSLGNEPEQVAGLLRRFMYWQIAFVAVWSVCFKGVLYVTLRHGLVHRLMSGSQSLGIAIPAEVLLLLLTLAAAARTWVRYA
jgi:hypothetical protein